MTKPSSLINSSSHGASGTKMKQERVDPGWAWTKKMNISAGVKVGDTVYLSGMVALDSDGNVVGEGDIFAQSKQVLGT